MRAIICRTAEVSISVFAVFCVSENKGMRGRKQARRHEIKSSDWVATLLPRARRAAEKGGPGTTRQTRREARRRGRHLGSVALRPSGTSDRLVTRRGRISIGKLPTFVSHAFAALLRLSSLRQFLLGKKQKFSNSSAATQKKRTCVHVRLPPVL